MLCEDSTPRLDDIRAKRHGDMCDVSSSGAEHIGICAYVDNLLFLFFALNVLCQTV